MKKVYSIEITPKTILTTILIIFLVWLFIILRGVILLIFISFAIYSMLNPIVKFLENKKLPKSLSIFFIYTFLILFVFTLLLIIYKPIAVQFEFFIRDLPDILVTFINALFDKIPFLRDNFNREEIQQTVKDSFKQHFDNIEITEYVFGGISKAFGIVGSIFSATINIITTIFLSIYFMNFKEYSKSAFSKLVKPEYHKRIFTILDNVEKQLGSWLRAQILLMLLIGFLAWMGFEIAGVKFSLPMGIIAGLLEIIPNIGPTFTWVLALIIGYGSGIATWKLIFIAIWFIAIQQFENYVIVPKLMQKAVGINPALTIIAIISLSNPKIFGPIGALIAVPVVAIVQIFFRFYLKYKTKN